MNFDEDIFIAELDRTNSVIAACARCGITFRDYKRKRRFSASFLLRCNEILNDAEEVAHDTMKRLAFSGELSALKYWLCSWSRWQGNDKWIPESKYAVQVQTNIDTKPEIKADREEYERLMRIALDADKRFTNLDTE